MAAVRFSLEIKNYRCFTDEYPAKIDFREGMTCCIGVNNAGKSTILRMLFELRSLFQEITYLPTVGRALKDNPNGTEIQIGGVADNREIFSDSNQRDITIVMRQEEEQQGSVPDALELRIPRGAPNKFSARILTPGGWVGGTSDAADIVHGQIRVPVGYEFGFGPYSSAARSLANAIYIPAVRNAVQVGATQPHYDLAIGQAFVEAWDDFKAGPDKQSKERAREVEREIGRIFGLEELQINAARGNETLQLFIGPRSFRLHELGAGLAQFIVVLGYAAIRGPSLILIDEPELNLHPALQLDFLTTLSTLASDGVVFATHNLGLARAVAEKIYTVQRVKLGCSKVELFDTTQRLASFAAELGFSAYQELGFEHILVVEGPTDVKVFQRLLRSYHIEHRVLLMHLGGRQSIHTRGTEQLLELQRITSNIRVLIDSERDSEDSEPPKRIVDFQSGCEQLGIQCHILERRALENYFPQAAVEQGVGDGFLALGPYERLGDQTTGWSKRNNVRIADHMTPTDLDGTDLGCFLDRLAESCGNPRARMLTTEPAATA